MCTAWYKSEAIAKVLDEGKSACLSLVKDCTRRAALIFQGWRFPSSGYVIFDSGLGIISRNESHS